MSDKELYKNYIKHELRLAETCIKTHKNLFPELQDLIQQIEMVIRQVEGTPEFIGNKDLGFGGFVDCEKELDRDFHRDLALEYT